MASRETSTETVWRELIDPTPVRIQRFRLWQIGDWHEMWRFRELLLFLMWRDIRVRYRQTMIGATWAIIQPVGMVAVLSMFLGKVARITSHDIPYHLYALCGLVPWLFFAATVNQAANSVLNSEKLVTKVYFPRLLIPLAATGTPLVDLAVTLFLLLIMLAFTSPMTLGLPLLLAPCLLLACGLTAIGIGSALASLNVAYRDFKFVIPLMMQLWLFATPSIYLDIHSAEFTDRMATASPLANWALQCNPIVWQVAMFRECMLGVAPSGLTLLQVMLVSVAIFLVGVLSFRSSEHRFADII